MNQKKMQGMHETHKPSSYICPYIIIRLLLWFVIVLIIAVLLLLFIIINKIPGIVMITLPPTVFATDRHNYWNRCWYFLYSGIF